MKWKTENNENMNTVGFHERFFEMKNKKVLEIKNTKVKIGEQKGLSKYYSAIFHERFFEMKNKKVLEIKNTKVKIGEQKGLSKYYSAIFHERFFEMKNKKVCQNIIL